MPQFPRWKSQLLPTVFILSGAFLLFLGVGPAQASFESNFQKASSGTLSASDWDSLLYDSLYSSGSSILGNGAFVNTWTTAHLQGPLTIGGYSTSSSLTVNGPISATNYATGTLTGTVSATNVSGGFPAAQFGANTGGGNYSFPGNVGIGITNPNASLIIQGASSVPILNVLTSAAAPSFYIDTNGLVGVGTTAPGKSLDVSTTFRTGSAIITGFVNNAGTVMTDASGNLYSASSSTSVLWAGSTAGNIWNLNSGNVGIGTTNPIANLDISNTTSTTTLNINMSGTGATTDNTFGIYALNNRGGYSGTPYRYGGYFEGRSYAATNNYTYGLEAVGNKMGGFGYGATGVLGIGRHTYQSYSTVSSNLIGVQGQIDFTDDSTTLADSGYGASLFTSANIPTNKTLATYYGLYLSAPTGAGTITKKYAIYQADTGAINYFGGNVGVGTTGPQVALQVNNANLESAPPALGTWGGQFSISRTSQYGLQFGILTNGNGWIQQARTDGTATAYNLLLNPIGGNVGIGTTNPTLKLDVASNGLNPPASSGIINNGLMRVGYSDRTWAGSELNIGIINSGAYPVWFQAQNPVALGTYRDISLNPNGGNVGIGVTNPGKLLDVNTTFRANSVNVSGFVNNAGVVMTDASGTLYSTVPTTGGGGTTLPSGVLGSTLYNNGSGWLAATSPLYNNGTNIGIGTTNPGQKLEVAGNLFINPLGTGDGLQFSADSANSYIDSTTNSLEFRTTRSNDNLIFQTNSSTRMYIDGSSGNVGIATTNPKGILDVYSTASSSDALVVASNGNVGIGVTAPGKLLDVNGTLRATGGVTFSSLAGVAGTVMTDSSGNLYSASSSSSVLWNGNTAGNIWNLNSGNVGIGVTNPDHILTVSQSNNTAFDNALTVSRTAAAGEWLAFTNIGGVYQGNDSAGDSFWSKYATWNLTNNRWESSYNGSIVGPTLVQWNYSGDVLFQTMAPQTLTVGQALVFNNTLTLKGNGNVGIGTTNPGYKLVVNGDIYGSGNLTLASTTGITLSGAGADLNFTGTGPNTITTASGVNLALMPGGTGNVGVGVTNPGKLLDVNTTFRAGSVNISGFNFAGIVMTDASGTLYTASSSGAVLWNGNTAGNIWNLNSGNVGIGTTNPITKLHVHSASSGNIFLMEDGSKGVLVQTLSTSGGVIGYNGSAYNNLDIRATAVEGSGIYLPSTGNVGIGTTNPGQKLEVAGNLFINPLGTGDGLQFSADSANSYIDSTTNSLEFRTTRSNDNLIFQTNSSTRMYIDGSSGNVGVGVGAPGRLLDVNTTFRAGSVNISGFINTVGTVMTDASGTLYAAIPAAISGI
jgi:hypothetical protein